MKIKEWKDDELYFNDGSGIYCEHFEECCEHNWADFDAAFFEGFDEKNEFDYFTLEPKEEGILITLHGYPHKIFGKYDRKVWVPCYSDQSGYYSDELTVNYSGADRKHKKHGSFDLTCEMR